ncbi:MAG: hypothetical protein NVSMB62_26880 [Acidobacteriaceae bacterium]
MSDSIVLVCAVLASLASGVLMAYGVCLAFFRAFEMRAAQTLPTPTVAVVAPQILQG